MSWKQRSVSLHTHTRLGDHTQTVLPGWRWRRSSSATRRQTKAVRRSLSFLSAPVLPVSSLLSKIKQARLPCACFQCRDPFGSTQLHTPNTPPNFSFCLFVCFFYIDFCVCVCVGGGPTVQLGLICILEATEEWSRYSDLFIIASADYLWATFMPPSPPPACLLQVSSALTTICCQRL